MIGVSLGDLIKLLDQVPGWKAVVGLPKRMKELEDRVASLEADLAKRPAKAAAPDCPLCGEPMKTVKVEPDRTFGAMGLQRHTLACTSCEHSEHRQVDPKKV